jgi:multidrug efflux pump subunit AcrB
MSQPNPPQPRFNLSEWALNHPALVRYLMLVLLVIGVSSYFQLGQDEDPPFTFRAMVVRAYWPGATASQMAEQVTDKIERTLQEVPYADKIRSYSKPGETLIIFQLKDSSPPREVSDIWYTVRKKVGDMRPNLPVGVQGPFFNDEFGDVYGVIFALQAPGFSPPEQKDLAESVRQHLLRVPDVAKVELYGDQSEKIYIDLSPARLAQYGLDMNAVLAQLGQQNAVESAGVLQSTHDQLTLRVSGAFQSPQEIRHMPIRANGPAQLRLGDIARVWRGPVDPPQILVSHQGQPVIALGVSMAKGGDIIALGQALQQAKLEIQARLPVGVTLAQIQDQPRAVATSVLEFVKVLVEAVVIVLLVSILALGLQRGGRWGWRVDFRPGLVVGITIPLVLAMTFLAMHIWGIGLHKISLGSLIIALGLLVDDAIIAVEMMVRKMEEGYDRFRAATFAYEVTAMPMLTGTLITAAGFVPIGLAKSVTGEYTFAIFAVTVLALLLSWWVSVFFVPVLGFWLLRPPQHPVSDTPHELFDSPFYVRFRALVTWCVDHRGWTIAVTVLTLVVGVLGMGKVQQQFFPDSSRPEILIDTWLPEGSSMAHNAEVSRRIEQRLMQASGVVSVTNWVGSGVPRFYLPLDQIFPQSNVSQFIVLPTDLKARERLRLELPALLASEFPEVRARVKLLPNGPPVPYPVQFRVVGVKPEVLRQRADEVKEVMRLNPNTRGVNDNWNESIKTVRLEIDQDKARALGVSSLSVAQALRLWASGTVVGQYREGDRLIDMVVRGRADERSKLDDLASTYVPSASGKAISLGQIVRPVLDFEPGVVWRENRQYAITVQSDIVEGLQGATVTQQLLPSLRQLEAQWAAKGWGDYRIEVAGAVEESAKGSNSIAAGMPLMLFIVFTLLMLQLQSFSRALLVFLTGPMGIAGVAAALLLLNRPFGFVALLGVIALMGMIQRNSVILIDQIEQDRRRGVHAREAIIEAAVRRLRPIVLTAAAAVLAMIPLSRSVFWGPMAVAIMGGLIVATVLTLLALPAMYAAWFRQALQQSYPRVKNEAESG